MTFSEAIEEYQDTFDMLPTIFGIPPDKEEDAARVLMQAVKGDVPLMDEEFYEKLDMEIPKGAVI